MRPSMHFISPAVFAIISNIGLIGMGRFLMDVLSLDAILSKIAAFENKIWLRRFSQSGLEDGLEAAPGYSPPGFRRDVNFKSLVARNTEQLPNRQEHHDFKFNHQISTD